MIRKRLEIVVNGRPWRIEAFLPVTRCDVNEVMNALRDIGCSGTDLRQAFENLTSERVNNGVTYSNLGYRATVTVFSRSLNGASYFNLIVHELHHLSVHIAELNGKDLRGEGVCYLNGDVAEALYPAVRRLL